MCQASLLFSIMSLFLLVAVETPLQVFGSLEYRQALFSMELYIIHFLGGYPNFVFFELTTLGVLTK